MTGAFHALDRPLMAAVSASQAGRWDDAIGLWRDQLRRPHLVPLAAACLAEAALRSGRQGLADQMLAQLDEVPAFLAEIDAADAGGQRPEALARLIDPALIAQFRSSHPLGAMLDEAVPIAPPASRPFGSRIRQGLRAAQFTNRIEQLQASAGSEAVRAFIARELRHAGRAYRSREIVYRAIFGLWKAGCEADDPVMAEALARWDGLDRGGSKALLEEARLQRALRFGAYARLLLRGAIGAGREDRRLRRRLAALAHERHRWADDADLLGAEDFAPESPRDAFAAMQEAFGEAGAPGDPLENAFARLLGDPARIAEPYRAENRLLMVGNTLACGGMERVMAASYRHFAESGPFAAVDMALLGYEAGAPSAHYADLAGVARDDIVLLDQGGSAPMPFALLPGSWKERCRKLHDHIAATRPRVIHAWNDLTGLLAAYAGLVAGCPKIIVHFHHGPSQPLASLAEPVASYPAVYRRLLERPEIDLLFCADAAARDYADWWRIAPSARLRRVYNGFDLPPAPTDRSAVRAELGLPAEATIIGTVGRLSPVKQPLVWADAAIRLAGDRGDTHFVWVGGGPLRKALRARFAEAGLADRLHLPGQRDDVPEWLAAFDLFWQTSASEGLPNALIEAQFAGVPIIAFDVGGVGETFVDGETGVLVQAGDSEVLVRETTRRLEDPAWLDRARREARAQAERRFSAGQFYAELAEVYGKSNR